jgi:hypothetical protein
MVGNLITDVVARAAKGDAKAAKMLEQYGLEAPVLETMRADIAKHGMDTTKWAASTWDGVRSPMTRMVDDAVLRARTGEIPAFAQFSSTGKFIFTFRNFTLASHNKVMARTLHQSGAVGLGYLLMHQLTLSGVAMAADQSATAAAGGKPTDMNKIATEAFNQTSALGLFSETTGIAFGTKRNVGMPGVAFIDRGYALGSATSGVVRGSNGGAEVGAQALNMFPLLAAFPLTKLLGTHIQD